MRSINQCASCHKLTTLSLCPRCDTATTPYFVHASGTHTGAHTADDGATKSPFAELTLSDINTLSHSRHGLTHSCEDDAQCTTGEQLERRVESLLSEKEELFARLQGDRLQMLRSAMAIRDLHESTKQLRQHDHDVIDALRRENEYLQKRLSKAEAAKGNGVQPASQNAAEAPTQAAPPSVHTVPLTAASPTTAADVVVSPSTTVSPATAPKDATGGFAESAFLQSPDQELSLSNLEDVPALQNEVKRLKTAVVHKTAQLDGLWERVERAERHILELLSQLGYAQDLAQEETRNSARLSHHLTSIGEPPDDIAAFMAIKDRHGTPRSTTSNSPAPSSISVLEHRNKSAGGTSAQKT